MIQLIPATVVAEMFLVLCGQLLSIYAIVRTDACDALCCGLNSILLKFLLLLKASKFQFISSCLLKWSFDTPSLCFY